MRTWDLAHARGPGLGSRISAANKKEKVKITRLHKVLKERKGSEFGDFSIWDPR